MFETISPTVSCSVGMDGVMEVENPAEVLRNENGVFEVTSPYGHVFEVTCKRGSKMGIREISRPAQVAWGRGVIWQIRRLRNY